MGTAHRQSEVVDDMTVWGPPGCPIDPGNSPRGEQGVHVGVKHRTWGGWYGDYSVGKGWSRPGIGFHWLVGKEPGRWVAFYPYGMRCNHAAGANANSVGIEVTGTDSEPFTEWQRWAVRQIVQWCASQGLPPVSITSPGRVSASSVNGWMNHAQVAGSDHGDYWQGQDDEYVMAGGPPAEEDDMFTDDDRAALQRILSQGSEEFRTVTSLGYQEIHGRHQWAYTDARGVLWRCVYRDEGPSWDKLDTGYMPSQWALLTWTKPESQWGESIMVTALDPEGKPWRCVWTDKDKWRSPEPLGKP